MNGAQFIATESHSIPLDKRMKSGTKGIDWISTRRRSAWMVTQQNCRSSNDGASDWVILAVGFTLTFLLLLWGWSFRRRKTLIFLSAGGTCRDPMAKAIASRLLQTRKLKHPIDIRAAGLGPADGSKASYAARYVIKEMYGEDLLGDHKPEVLTKKLARRADLILVMDRSLLTTPGKTLPPEKTFLLKEFFGGKGDVIDPYPDGMGPKTLSKYRDCAEELRKLRSFLLSTSTRWCAHWNYRPTQYDPLESDRSGC